MKLISKRYLIKIPDKTLVLYCDQQQQLLILKNNKKILMKLKVKILFLKKTNYLIVTDLFYNKNSNKYKNTYKSLQGTTVSLIKKAFLDVSVLTYKKLQLVGVGYKVFENNLHKQLLHFKLGYSHSIYYKIPEGVKIKLLQSTKLFIYGFNSKLVSQTASFIRQFKIPEPYKGKGIRYSNETVMLKPGKKV